MTSQSSADAEMAWLVNTMVVSNYVNVATSALVLWEYLITLGDEICFVWTSRLQLPSLLFIANRVVMLIFALAQIFITPDWNTNSSCEFSVIINVIAQVPPALIWAVFSALRVFGMTNASKISALLVLGISLVPVFLTIYYNATIKSVTAQPLSSYIVGCDTDMTASNSLQIGATIASGACNIITDAIVLGVTWWKTYGFVRGDRQDGVRSKSSLASLVLIDGTLYFIAMIIINIVQIVMTIYVPGMSFLSTLSSALVQHDAFRSGPPSHAHHDLTVSCPSSFRAFFLTCGIILTGNNASRTTGCPGRQYSQLPHVLQRFNLLRSVPWAMSLTRNPSLSSLLVGTKLTKAILEPLSFPSVLPREGDIQFGS